MDHNVTYRKKDKSIQCIISYKDENGKWRQKSKQGFKAQKDAKPWIKETVEELEDKIKLAKVIDPLLVDISFGELCDLYLKHKELYVQFSTLRNIKFAIKKFNKLDDIEMFEIKKLHIQSCVDDMVREGLTPTSVSNYLGMVRSVFKYAITNKIIKDNPCVDIQVLAKSKEDDRIKALTKSELNDLLSKIKNHRHNVISLIAATCGLRLGEILGLTWDNINFKESTMTVNKNWKRLAGNNWGFGSVKQKNSNRIVPVPPNTLKELRKYKINSPTDINNRLFLDRSVVSLSTTLSRKYRKLGYDITVHDLRHTYATMLISNGVDFKTAAKLLGHDIEMTMKVYSHVTDDMISLATKKINTMF